MKRFQIDCVLRISVRMCERIIFTLGDFVVGNLAPD